MHRRILLALALSLTAGLALVDLTCAQPQGLPATTDNNNTNGCPSGQQSCGGTCVDVKSDAANCGGCGQSCSATQTCNGGSCQCKSGLMACGASCVDVGSDAAHCGSCANVCTSSQLCDHGACKALSAGCSTGLTVCGQSCVDLVTNQTNCGACGMMCAAGRSCSGSQCGCPIGQTLCGTSCVDLATNGSNCGMCGKACGSTQICASSACGCAANQFVCPDQKTCAANAAACNTGNGGAGGGGMGGAGGTGGGGVRPPNCAAGPNVIADFEDGTDTEVVQGGRTGWWFTFADTLGGSIMQAPNQVGPIATAMVPTSDSVFGPCNHYAFHSTATGRQGANTGAYAGFGTSIAQVMPTPPAGSKTKNPYDVSAYKGVSFSIKSGTASPPPIWFEFLNVETTGAPAGSPPNPDGTATHPSIDLYNTRGKLITNLTTNWQTIFIPFGLLGPRYLPAGTTCAGAFCEAPGWNPKTALGLQFSMYPQFTASAAYDLWVDNVTFITDDSGVATFAASAGTAKPFPRDGAVGSCPKPAGAAGKFLVDAYLRWKATFVTGTGNATRVQRPENANDTVSEGIGYGMLIAAMMGDKTLFDGLWGYWTAHVVGGTMLMNWTCPGGANCSGNSATDADEDAAYALLLASKQWGGTYLQQATTMIGQIWTSDIEAGSLFPKGGNAFGGAGLTNPSYFAPAYYRIFATVDTAAGHNWLGVANTVYTALASVARVPSAGGQGLVPAWCSGNCTAAASNGGVDDTIYQYDAHRVPWRIGLDFCWNGTAAAKTYLATNTSFFVGKSQTAGLGSVVDIYTLGGAANGDAQPNSMSAVGSAAVGAMANASGVAADQDFLNRAYRFILDANYTADPAAKKSAYSYFNASVGLMTALTMTGNFPDYRNF